MPKRARILPLITTAPHVNVYLRGPSVFCAQTQKRKIDRKGYRELRGRGFGFWTSARDALPPGKAGC